MPLGGSPLASVTEAGPGFGAGSVLGPSQWGPGLTLPSVLAWPGGPGLGLSAL